MEIKDIWPIVIPGSYTIQAYFIRHCWLNNKITQKKRQLILPPLPFLTFRQQLSIYLLQGKGSLLAEVQEDNEVDSQIARVFCTCLWPMRFCYYYFR